MKYYQTGKEFRLSDACPPLAEEAAVSRDDRRRRPPLPTASPVPCPLCGGQIYAVMGQRGPHFVCDCKRAA